MPGVDSLCLRMVRLLSRACASYGTSAVHLLLLPPTPGGGDDKGSGRLLARLVGTVHQEIEGLLLQKGSGPTGLEKEEEEEAGTRRRSKMLARESFALLTLLSANNPAGLSAGLSGAGCRWTLDAVNFRLMNRLVEGLEGLMEDAEQLQENLGAMQA